MTRSRRMFVGSSLSALLCAGTALAQPTSPAPTPTPTPVPAPAEPVPSVPDPEAAAEATEPEPEPEAEAEPEPIDLEAKAQELEAKVAELESKLTMVEQSRKSRFPVKLTGYGDIGLFATQGDGAGVRRDVGHALFPQYNDIGWVFYGDLLATSINTRGDVADLGELPGVNRFDSVNSGGATTFLVNELNLGIQAGLGEKALFTSSVNFTPRTGTEFSLGDSFDVDLAQVEYMPTSDGKTSLFVGKVDSVIGIEYKQRKAHQRFGITPSLLARYTTGTAVGVKARTILLGDKIILAAAVTNGTFSTEQFHFFNEVDTNSFKTLSGRGAFRLPVGDAGTFEAGVSGQFGTQDGAPDGSGDITFVGVDAELELFSRIALRAQYLRGEAPGDDRTMTYSLDLDHAAYLEGQVILTPEIGVYGRGEFRNAETQQGMDRLYITKSWRSTAGVRLIFNPNAVIKAEYSHNGEYGEIAGTKLPSIPNDVITTSAVMAF